MSRERLTEAGQLAEAKAASDGTIPVQIITPGWGSSGHYSATVLEAAAKAKVWPAGSHLYWDHPSVSESEDRPERSVKDLGAVLAEDAHWDGTALVARATPVGFAKEVLADAEFRKAIGVSVRAMADVEVGEADGRTGWIVKELVPDTFNSVDFVTHAGRGGRIREVLESARHARLSEATANDTREALNAALKDEYGADKTWIWVRDFDEATVWFEVETEDSTGVFAQAYSLDDDGAAALTGDRTEVRVKTQYVPVGESTRPDLTREAAITAVREARNVGQWMESRIHLGFTQVADEMFGNGKLTREERIALSSGIGDALAAFTTSVEKAAPQLYQRDLWTDPDARVAAAEAHAPNVPVHPAGQSNTTKEHTMPDIEEGAKVSISETRLRQLEADAGRVPALEAKVASESARADQAEQDLAIASAREYARTFGVARVKESNDDLPSPVVDKIVAAAMLNIPLTEAEKAADRRLDTEAFGKQVDDARVAEETYLASIVESGHGLVRGVGSTDSKTEVTEADVDNIVAGAFGRKTVKGA
jgi:hypothetical protein